MKVKLNNQDLNELLSQFFYRYNKILLLGYIRLNKIEIKSAIQTGLRPNSVVVIYQILSERIKVMIEECDAQNCNKFILCEFMSAN